MTRASGTIAATLQPFVDAKVLSGAVTLVASREKVLSLEAVGCCDLATRAPMRTDHLFWIASVSKPITATAFMMLVDEGKVRVDDPVEKYLPEFKGQMLLAYQDESCTLLKKPSRPIAVRDILSHTSGLPFMSRVEQRIDTRPLREAVVSYAMTPLNFEPGTKYAYANAGTNTAGRIVEVVSGMPYEQFLQERLLGPLGMTDTVFVPSREQVARIAKSYRPNASKDGLEEIQIDQLTYPLTGPGRYPCPAGGLFSTAADIGTFGQMILNGGVWAGRRYVSEVAVRQMTSTQTGTLLSKEGNEDGYGFAWSTRRRDPGSGPAPAGECGHGGAYSNELWIDPQRGLVTVFMVQHQGWSGNGNGASACGTFKQAACELHRTHT